MKKISMIAVMMAAGCMLPMMAQAGVGGLGSPVPEPSTIVAGAACLIPIGVGLVRAMRKNRK